MTKRKNSEFAVEFENNETPTIMLGQYYGVEEPNEPQDERLNGESGDEFYELFEIPQPVADQPVIDQPVPNQPVLDEDIFNRKCLKSFFFKERYIFIANNYINYTVKVLVRFIISNYYLKAKQNS